ncbi:hypothetical protein D5086_017520 [Populus alba]|uniref:Uncharacterized protein n=1 Tax=Populus alba TaxID=43335 RepID=A0ACC4BMV0_POPAL
MTTVVALDDSVTVKYFRFLVTIVSLLLPSPAEMASMTFVVVGVRVSSSRAAASELGINESKDEESG